MKAERRHELKENDLAHGLSVAREYFDQQGARIGLYVVAAVVVVGAVSFGLRSRAAAVEDVWRRKAQLNFTDLEVGRQSLEALASMTEGVSDESFVLASLSDQGIQALRLAGRVTVPPDRELNEQAEDAFHHLLARFPGNRLAFGVAHSGLVTVEQNYFVLDSDPVHKDRAAKHLAAIIENPALDGMPFKRLALERRDQLEETFTVVTFEHLALPEAAPADDDQADPADLP